MYTYSYKFFILVIMGLSCVGSLIPERVTAQTCSCAGAPLVSSQSAGVLKPGNISIGLTYQYNDISEIYSGVNRQQQQVQKRNTESYLIEVSYGLFERLSITASMSFVAKERVTGLNTSNETQVQVSGPGDALISLNALLVESDLWNPYQLTVFGGLKVPIGRDDVANSNIRFNADMQPGTGSVDGIFGFSGTRLLRSAEADVSISARYRINGENERFSSDDNYSFGNRFTFQSSIRKQVGDFVPAIGVEFRDANQDHINGINLANTGGKWLFIQPTLQAGISEKVMVILTADIPVYTEVNGVQPSTKIAVTGSLFIAFGKADSRFIRY